MADGEKNLKYIFGAETGELDKGVNKVKREMKDLNKVSMNALSAIGDALGVDVGKIQQFSSALQGLGNKLNQTGEAGTKAFGSIAQSISPVAAGIAGLGLGAAIIAFKQLNAEADAFERTIQGGVIKAQTDAYINTFRQSIRDQQGIGAEAATFRQTVKEAGATIAGFFQSGFDMGVMQNATQQAERAKKIAKDLYDIDLQRKENSVQIAQLDSQIAQQREIISDSTRSAAERSAALATAQQLIKDKLDLQLPLAERQRDLIAEYNSLASTTIKDYDAEIAAKVQVNNLIAQEAAEQRSLLRSQNSINNAVAAEVAARAAARKEMEAQEALAQQIAARGLMMQGWANTFGQNAVNIAIPKTAQSLAQPSGLAPVELQVSNWAGFFKDVDGGIFQQWPNGVEVGVKFKYKDGLIDMTKEINSGLISLAETTSTIIGDLVGDLATGGDAWQNFSNAALSAFGDMAVAVGKIAIEAGVASMGIEGALALAPEAAPIAIAAGAALVVLGSAVKTGLSNVAAGNYSGGVSVASANYGSYNSDYSTREVNVNVTGTLKADGDQLVAVITNTQNNSYYQT